MRSTDDRRYVMTRITKKGLALLGQVDPVVTDLISERFGHMSEDEQKNLNSLLARARDDARGA